jgi:hypothetical protein
MRSMTQSNYPCWECLGARLPLQIMATNWPPADEIDACSSALAVAITKVILGHKTSSKNHLTGGEEGEGP